jgi:hypothetical protein
VGQTRAQPFYPDYWTVSLSSEETRQRVAVASGTLSPFSSLSQRIADGTTASRHHHAARHRPGSVITITSRRASSR